MKKMKFLFALALMMGFGLSAFAQVTPQSDNADIKGLANVVAQVAVTKFSDLDFKNVAPGVVKTINFVNTVTAGTTNGGETTGRFDITKGANTQVTLEFTALPTSLDGTGGASGNTLPISYTTQLFKESTTAHPIAPPAQGNTVIVQNSSTTAPYYATDAFQLDLGGTVTPATTQVAGAYEGVITLTATYN